MVYGFVRSMVLTSHSSRPVAASSAIRRPSSEPTNTLPFHRATPRLTTSQHALTAHSPGTSGSYAHRGLPVAASYAFTLLHAVDTYRTPSATSGVASCPRRESMSANQARPSCDTLSALMRLR